jgi:hypothetical protein
MRIIVSLTTIPSRINKIEPTIKSIINQTLKPDYIYLNLPNFSIKEQTEYNIPEFIINYPITVLRCNDYGPITKLIPTLLMENDPETIIITIDDDNLYPKNLIELLINKSRVYPNDSIGSSGIQIGKFPFYTVFRANQARDNIYWFTPNITEKGEYVDIISGYPGVLYKRKFFGNSNDINNLIKFSSSSKDLFLNDDITISAFLDFKDIKRRIFNLPEIKDSNNKNNGLSDQRLKFLISCFKAVCQSQYKGYMKNKVPVNYWKTATFPIIIILLILFIFVIYYFLNLRKKSVFNY